MNRSMIIGVVLGVGVATAGGAIAGYKIFKEPDHADVLSAQPITKQVKVPHKECADKTVVHQREVKDDNRVAGKAVGAILGGVLGHQVGGGNGKKVATVAGAVAGGYAGDRVQGNMQKNDTYTTVENVCSTTYTTRDDITGYDVTYRLKGKESTVRMSYDPGSKIPLQNGQLVLNSSDQ
ncbi:MAG: glycine zipper 2TM domain-containing protein [Pedobacter sp.]|nr:MAG: glycine zipper 2TM domain-containing protein [Pedobacter sp.]